MTRQVIVPPFNPALPVVVRRPFTANGHRWAVGQNLPWRQMAISRRKVAQLYRTGFLRHTAQGSVAEESGGSVPAFPPPNSPATPIREKIEPPTLPPVSMELTLKELTAIATDEGAPIRQVKKDQIEAIMKNRLEGSK